MHTVNVHTDEILSIFKGVPEQWHFCVNEPYNITYWINDQ